MSLNHAITDYVRIALESPKVAANVGLGTIMVATFREWIDGIIAYLGTSAVAIGAILSIVLIYNNIKMGVIRRKLTLAELEIALLEEKKLRRELEEMRSKNG